MKNMHDLFVKYLNNQCSPDEVKELLTLFNIPGNEEKLRGLIIESLEKENDDEVYEWNPALDQSFSFIKNQLDSERVIHLPFYKRNWFRFAAAAMIFLIGSLIIYKSTDKNTTQEIVKTDSKSDITPGYYKAILTLADGSTIQLERSLNGIISKQGKTKLEKSAEGQLVYTSLDVKSNEDFFNTISTPRGGQYQLVLADGSKVWLNSASTLRYPVAFNGNDRVVELVGEAYFEVAKNVSKPFKVTVDNKMDVQVLGTHFNVNAYRDEDAVKTTLMEGQVNLIVLASGINKKLSPGEQAQLQNNGKISILKNANTEQATAWKEGSFSFSNADLGTVMQQLARWYDIDVKFETSVPERHFDGEIQRDLKLPQVLKILERNNIFCTLQGKTLTVLK